MRLRRRLEREIEGLRKLQGRRSRFSDAWAYFADGREIVHFHSDHAVDVRLTRRVIRGRWEVLAADARVRLGGRQRDWVEVTFASVGDLPFVLELVRLAIRANS